ncbi:transposase [Nostoc flagelliforme FACHB-838]|uniref:Transposase n=1 Tax=Nostoc flagelliforme FACHB-838 TaxID=2692904 RepID=A0ABR8E0F0_9NOSO|nr:transposase [Nostoc flagelliforme]MBD2534582.1 transposase [Nostoc flagelliforme FACHB-838]
MTVGSGMPLANCTTVANGNEKEQILPLLDKVKLKTLKRGKPRKKLKLLATDKGYDSKEKRAALRKRGIRPQIPKRVWKTRKNRGIPIKISVPRFQQERCFAWYQRKYRRLGVRWERIKVYFNAFIQLATIHNLDSKSFISGIGSSNYNQQSISVAYKTLISNPPAPCPNEGISLFRIAPVFELLSFFAPMFKE